MGKIVRTVCQDSHSECGVLVHVEDGRVTKIEGDPEHPESRGFICVKGIAQIQILYHPDRLKYPLKRAGGRGEGKWERIPWAQALSEIAGKFTEIKGKYDPEANGTYVGTGPRGSSIPQRLLATALGTPTLVATDLHICYAPSLVAEINTLGQSITMEEGPDYLSANCILVCGGNPLVSHPPRGMDILEAMRARKAKLIVIDPRRIPLARRADLWLQVRPGTDAALVLGMIHTIIEEELYDKEFVDRWCHGFDRLKEHVRDYTPEKAAEISWVPADKIREAARLYATIKPAALHHRVAIEQNINSTQTVRALTILIALTGNIDIKGGNLLRTPVEGYTYATVLRRSKRFRPAEEIEKKRIGAREYPLVAGPEAKCLPFVPSYLFVETMFTGKPYSIKSLYCAGGNPVLNMQNAKKVWQALKKLEMLVVVDFFMTPTAELADYVLPATTWIERDECCDQCYMNCIAARQKAIEPLYECWDDMKIAIELVKRIPWANKECMPWNDMKEYNEYRLSGTGMTFEELKEKGYIVVPPKYKKYEREGFDTPTGKVELYSTVFEKYGYDPLPTYVEPPESPVSTPELMKEYPLILTTGGRYIEYYHSEQRQVPRLRERIPDPEVQIHPDAAKKANIEDGDWVWIETPRVKGERVRLKAKFDPYLHSMVVHAAHGWWFPEKPGPEHGCFESNISVVLSADPPREPICGSVPLRGTLCRVYK